MVVNKQEATIKRNYFNSALQLLFKFDSPTDDQIYHHLCTQNHCPTKQCTYMFGFKQGRLCDHVFTVKRIVKNLRVML